MTKLALGLTFCLAAFAAKLPPKDLYSLAQKGPSPALAQALTDTFDAKLLTDGKAVSADGGKFVYAVKSSQFPELYVDGQPSNAHMQAAAKGENLYYATGEVRPGTSHSFYYMVGGQKMGGQTDVAAYLPDSYEQPGVPQGKLTDKRVHTSKLYDGMLSDYWVYAPAGYNSSTPAAVMIWQDGAGHVDTRDKGARTLTTIDNLTAQKKIPVIVHIFISPGKIGDRAMRSIEYDTVSDKYTRFLLEEILPEVAKDYNLRTDGYSRAITGASSGGICAFTAAWFHPDQFTRVLSRIGSFTSIQWHQGQQEGGDIYPFWIRKEKTKRNIRVWLQDGAEDLENEHGSWPLQNLQMANSLKRMEYDFHLSFGTGTHNGAQGNAEMPVSLAWIWRDYDPAKTSQTFVMDPAEKDKPFFRVQTLNRER